MNHWRPLLLQGVAALGLIATSALLLTGATFAQPNVRHCFYRGAAPPDDQRPCRGRLHITYGFPLASLLSSGPSLTTGDISALGGMNNNLRMMQTSAPIQPGNSGGPLFDLGGLVIGVVVATLNPHRVGERTVTPQNVNFVFKGAKALTFLREQNVAVTPLPAREPLRGAAADVGDLAHRSVMFLRCFRWGGIDHFACCSCSPS